MILTSYHNHTTWSDGKSPLADMLTAAVRDGVSELGISDHFILHPAATEDNHFAVWWGMNTTVLESATSPNNAEPSNLFRAYISQFDKTGKTGQVKLCCGIEADFFPETVDKLRSLLNDSGSAVAPLGKTLDYVIGSVHYVRMPHSTGFPANYFLVDDSAKLWESLASTDNERRDVWNEIGRLYWVAVRELAEHGKGVYDFVGHIDLIKKFGTKYLPTQDVHKEIESAFDAIRSSGMAIELNTAGWRKPVHEQYPSQELLRTAFTHDIPVLITSDAHHSSELTSGFGDAYKLLSEIGYRSVLRYKKREPIPVLLDTIG